MSTTPFALQISNSVPGYMAKLFVSTSAPVQCATAAEVATVVTVTATFPAGATLPVVGGAINLAGFLPAGYNGAAVVSTIATAAGVSTITFADTTGLGAVTQIGTVTAAPVNFGELEDITVTEMRDMLDATSHDAQGAKIKKPGLYDWNASAKGLFLAADVTQVAMRAALSGSVPLFITIYPQGVGVGLIQKQGACYVKDIKFSGPVKDIGTAEFSLEGSGFLLESLQAAA